MRTFGSWALLVAGVSLFCGPVHADFDLPSFLQLKVVKGTGAVNDRIELGANGMKIVEFYQKNANEIALGIRAAITDAIQEKKDLAVSIQRKTLGADEVVLTVGSRKVSIPTTRVPADEAPKIADGIRLAYALSKTTAEKEELLAAQAKLAFCEQQVRAASRELTGSPVASDASIKRIAEKLTAVLSRTGETAAQPQ